MLILPWIIMMVFQIWWNILLAAIMYMNDSSELILAGQLTVGNKRTFCDTNLELMHLNFVLVADMLSVYILLAVYSYSQTPDNSVIRPMNSYPGGPTTIMHV